MLPRSSVSAGRYDARCPPCTQYNVTNQDSSQSSPTANRSASQPSQPSAWSLPPPRSFTALPRPGQQASPGCRERRSQPHWPRLACRRSHRSSEAPLQIWSGGARKGRWLSAQVGVQRIDTQWPRRETGRSTSVSGDPSGFERRHSRACPGAVQLHAQRARESLRGRRDSRTPIHRGRTQRLRLTGTCRRVGLRRRIQGGSPGSSQGAPRLAEYMVEHVADGSEGLWKLGAEGL